MSKLLHAPTDLLSSHFVCRTSELQGIQDGFSSLLGSAPSRIILWGMPGVGKTQLALRYAVSQYNTKYTHVFWVSASTTAKIYQALESFLDELDSPDRYSTEQHIKLTAARKWLEDESYGTERSWLLVFDNANRDTVATIRDVIPKSNRRGNILITTKGQDVAEALSMTAGEGCPCYEVQTPDEQDAAIMLLDIASMRAAQDAEMLQQATQLVKQLGCLPLAIGHVASFMRRSRIGLQGMLDILSSEEKTKCLGWENKLSMHEENSVNAAFASIFLDTNATAPQIGSLLRLLVFLDPEGIPTQLLVRGFRNILHEQENVPSVQLQLIRTN